MKNGLLFLFCVLVFVGCNKPEENPEKLDPIYEDLEKQKKEVAAQVGALEKQLEEFKKAAEEVEPQTGQIKFAMKRVYETAAKLEKMKQMALFYELHAEKRLEEDRKNYLEAYNKGKPWPDPTEWETYKSQKALEQAPTKWSVQNRKEILTPVKKEAPKHGE